MLLPSKWGCTTAQAPPQVACHSLLQGKRHTVRAASASLTSMSGYRSDSRRQTRSLYGTHLVSCETARLLLYKGLTSRCLIDRAFHCYAPNVLLVERALCSSAGSMPAQTMRIYRCSKRWRNGQQCARHVWPLESYLHAAKVMSVLQFQVC